MYAKCIKGHVLKDANDWILCENLPAPDARCWQEGGETLFSLRRKRGNIANAANAAGSQAAESSETNTANAAAQRATS